MENKKKFCILLATYNGERHLREQIGSILNQSGVDCDIFVSDDCSSDETPGILKEYAFDTDLGVTLLRSDRKFGCAAANFYRLLIDVDFSNYDFVALSDQDDIWLKNRLERAVLEMKKHQAVAYSSNVTAFWSNGSSKLLVKSNQQRKYDFLFEPAGPGCTYIFSRDTAQFLRQSLLRSKYLINFPKHDWLLYALVRSANMVWFIDSFSGLMYRQHGLNEVGANVGIKAKLIRLKMLRSGEYLNNVRRLCAITGIDPSIFFSKNPILMRILFLRNIFYCRRNILEAFYLFLTVLFGISRVS